jgi:hypothetical protein
MNWARPLKSKYGAQRTKISGYSFASKIEAQRFAELELLKRAGEVLEIQVQPQVRLSAAEIVYKPDFLVTWANGEKIWEEVKGFETPEWRIKRRLWLAYGPGKLRVFRARGGRLVMTEELGGANA